MCSVSVHFLYYELSVQCGSISRLLVVYMICFALQMSLGYPSKGRKRLRTMSEGRIPSL